MADTPELIPDVEPAKEAESIPQQAPKEELYVQIKPGDTLEEFAKKYETTSEAILERNQLHPSDFRFGYWVFV